MDLGMENHERFAAWAAEQGVKLNGVKAHSFESRGLGIIAERDLKAQSVILTVPYAALRTVHTVPKAIAEALNPTTVHNCLAVELSLEPCANIAPWKAVLPCYSQFLKSMPLLYPEALQDLLPPAAKVLVLNQKRKLESDWASSSRSFPALNYETYLHNWLLVNTRTFYFLSPKHRGALPSRDDCIALNPFADHFNHSSKPACSVIFTKSQYKVVTDADISEGDEVCISYGNHSNDFLLVEYGFILDVNHDDMISINKYIIPLFSPPQRKLLMKKGYWDNYVLDKKGICYRTQIAVRLLCMPVGEWERILNGWDDGELSQVAANEIVSQALHSCKNDVVGTLQILRQSDFGHQDQRHTLIRRWEQIDLLVISAIQEVKILKD